MAMSSHPHISLQLNTLLLTNDSAVCVASLPQIKANKQSNVAPLRPHAGKLGALLKQGSLVDRIESVPLYNEDKYVALERCGMRSACSSQVTAVGDVPG